MNDQELMRKALECAEKGWGKTSPNPMVGAIIVKNGEIVGSGYHAKAGEAHAEVNAINDAGSNASGADLYVTLEPCSSYGRTPPCTEAIKKAGIKSVFVGALDPNPKHRGAAITILHEAGIQVFENILREECAVINEAFFKWITTGKPFVLLKMAMTLDGKIATHSGTSQWITGEQARQRVQHLRQWADAVMIGAGTARQDHPALKVREPQNWPRQPRRLVVSKSMTAAEAAKTLADGVTPEVLNGTNWDADFRRLGSEKTVSILVEGGGELAASLLNAGEVDKIEFHIAMKILGGRDSRPVVGGKNPSSLADAVELFNTKTFQAGQDLIVTGYPAMRENTDT